MLPTERVYGFRVVIRIINGYFLNVNQLIVVMKTCCVFFAVRTECLNII
jgi:hypothetical protein